MSEQLHRGPDLLAARKAELLATNSERLAQAVELQTTIDAVLDHDDPAVRHRRYEKFDDSDTVTVAITDAYVAAFASHHEFSTIYYLKREIISDGTVSYLIEPGALKAIYPPRPDTLGAISDVYLRMTNNKQAQPESARFDVITNPRASRAVDRKYQATAEQMAGLTNVLQQVDGETGLVQLFDTSTTVIEHHQTSDEVVTKVVEISHFDRMKRAIGHIVRRAA